MLTSVEILEATGISRATLNNYIALGLLPRPQVRQPEGEVKTRARQIGYFPADTIDRINAIQALKRDGLSLSEIAERMGQENLAGAPSPAPNVAMVEETGALRLTVDEIPYPAYMVNYNLEITWYNEEACSELLGAFERLPTDAADRGVLDFLRRGRYGETEQTLTAMESEAKAVSPR